MSEAVFKVATHVFIMEATEGNAGVDGFQVTVRGPGMPAYANELVVWREYDVERLTSFLYAAYEAGKRAKAAEIRAALAVR